MNHLTSEQISEWMIGTRGAEQVRHVAECSQCAQAVGRMEGVLANFGGAYREWGANQMQAARPAPERPRALLWLRTAIATAVLAAVAVAIPVRQHFKNEEQRAAQIAMEDDALLTQIQADVSRAVPASLKPLAELEKTTGSAQ